MKRLISMVVAGVFASAAVFAQMDLQEAARIQLLRTEPITVKQLRLEAEKLIWRQLMQEPGRQRQPSTEEINRALQSMTKEDKLQVLNALINQKLVMQAAERDKITVTDNEINAYLNESRARMQASIGRSLTDAQFATAVREETGQDVPAFRDEIRRQMVLQRYINFKYEDRIKSINVTAEEIQNYYTLQRAQLVRPETVRVSLIEVPFTDADSKVKAKELADRLVREIGSSPAKFDETSKKAAAPNAGYNARNAGYLPRNLEAQRRVGTEFLNTAFSLKQGEVSKLIETAGAYYIIKITETYEQKNLELDDIFALEESITVREYIRRGLLQQKQRVLLDQVSQELVAELRKVTNPNNPPYRIFENNLNW
jgi:parvulin-like peptidyl-prolyl isomerase